MDALERLSQDQAERDGLLALTHVHRYRLAAELCAELRVLDLCCGSGYGTKLLAERARTVHGVDLHGPSIEHAAGEAADDPRLSFERADALDVLERPLRDDFDAIVLYEGLEHLDQLERAVESLRAQVAAGLGLIVSLPNSRAFGEENPFHVTEFDYERAVATFERIGAAAVLFQFHAEGSLIRTREDGPLDGSSTLAERAEPEHCNHLIALAGLGPERAPASARMELAAAPAFNAYMLDLERSNERLWQTNLRLSRERLGIADSAAAATVERLRRADEEAEALRRATPPPQPLLVRVGAALKRALVLILPHGLVLAWVVQGSADEADRADEAERADEAGEAET